jgi:hypothetical protein
VPAPTSRAGALRLSCRIPGFFDGNVVDIPYVFLGVLHGIAYFLFVPYPGLRCERLAVFSDTSQGSLHIGLF